MCSTISHDKPQEQGKALGAGVYPMLSDSSLFGVSSSGADISHTAHFVKDFCAAEGAESPLLGPNQPLLKI